MKRLPLLFALASAFGVAALAFFTVSAATMPTVADNQETIVLGQTTLSPGSVAGLRILVRDHGTAKPVAGAGVRVSLEPRSGSVLNAQRRTVFTGRTDATGTATVSFTVPNSAESAQNLVVESESASGRDRVVRPITVQRAYKVLLTTDKPLYQPGQTVHVRALALSSQDLSAAKQQRVEFVVEDAKGNKVFRQGVGTSEFGVAAADFELASEVNSGDYKVKASLGSVTSEKTVSVKGYVLPKFKAEATVERPFYAPGERVKGKVVAGYFFGKPVDGAIVSVTGYTFDVGRKEALRISGRTDASGAFSFEFVLPSYFAAGGLDQRQSSFSLEISVTDKADHTEQTSLSLPIASDRLVIDAVPESGSLKPGIENLVYIVTSYPDGSPAPCQVTVTFPDGKTGVVNTGRYGLGEARWTPPANSRSVQLRVSAKDDRGNSAATTRTLAVASAREYLLLRADRATAQVGETVHLDVFTSAPAGDAFLDVVRDKQTISTRVLAVTAGRAAADLDLSPDLFGTLELHAYKVLSDGSIVRDTRLVVVSAPRDLTVSVTPDRDTYLPGGEAKITYLVTDRDGRPAQAALGVAGVDESVFALAEMDPGFAKLYFLLEKELMSPQYEIHGFSMGQTLAGPPADAPLRAAQQTSAQAALAKTRADQSPFGLTAFSFATKQQDLNIQRRNAFRAAADATSVAMLAVAVLVVGMALARLRRDGLLARALGWSIGAVVAVGIAAVGLLVVIMSLLSTGGALLAAAALGFTLALILLAVAASAAQAWRHQDAGLAVSLGLVLAYGVLTVLLAYMSSEGQGVSQPAFLLAYLLLPLAFVLRGVGLGLASRRAGLGAALLLALVLTLPVPAVLAISQSPLSGSAPAQRQDGVRMLGGGLEAAPPPRAAASAPLPTQVAATDASKGLAGAANNSAGGTAEPPRLRQFFPETLFWQPNLLTDARGVAEVTVPIADSITTWRLTALASSQKGELGVSQTGLRVFQDFFVDLDLPVALTQNDEIAVPVAVYNYLPQSQKVKLTLTQEAWFTSQDAPEKELVIASNDITAVYFRIKVNSFGQHRLTVTAAGERLSDAIARSVAVIPDGKRLEFAVSDRLPSAPAQRPLLRSVTIPDKSIAGASRLLVKIYPGFLSQAVEGLDGILRMPSGCFEQTSSTTYPNVLVLTYLKRVSKLAPDTQLKAERYINLGYQRLTTFEVAGGGFSLFGQAPADTMLSAYGVMEFSDMASVSSVDKALIDRTVRWILSQQQPDGSWTSQMGLTHNSTWDKLKNSRLPVTAYIAWALAEAGYKSEAARGVGYVKEYLAQAEDPYVLALAANALAAYDAKDPQAKQAADRLESLKVVDGDAVYWKSGVETMMGASGRSGSVENTALATYALLRLDAYPDTVNKALTYLIKAKDPKGTWYTTQATVLALKSLLLSVSRGEQSAGTVQVRLNGQAASPIILKAENADVVQMVAFGPEVLRNGENRVELSLDGTGNVLYQISGEYYLPWSQVPPTPDGQELIDIAVRYDRTSIAVNDVVTASVSIKLTRPGTANWVLVDLGLPPGFDVLTEDLNALVDRSTSAGGAAASGQPGAAPGVPAPIAPRAPTPSPAPKGAIAKASAIKRYDLTGRQVIVYLETLAYGQPVEFAFRLRARYPIKAQTLASTVYDYYNPDTVKVLAPTTISVQ